MGWQARWAGGLLAASLVGLGVANAYAAGTRPAVAVIDHFQKTLLTVMKQGHRLGFKGRYKALAPAVRASHNLPFIAKITLGPYWGRLSPSERAAFVKTFGRLTIATYAAQFTSYSGQRFQETAAHPIGRNDVLVETELMTHGHKRATLDYLVARGKAHWKIINIVANGVSDLALKRAQYTSIIRKKGFPALLRTLRTKVAQLSRGGKAR